MLSKQIQASEIIAYSDLGTEAIRRFSVVGFPVIVVNDCYGGDAYADGLAEYGPPN